MRLRIVFVTVCFSSLILITFVARYNKLIFLERLHSLSSRNNSAVQFVNKWNTSSQTKITESLQPSSSSNNSIVEILLSNELYTKIYAQESYNLSQTTKAIQALDDNEWKNIYESHVDLTKGTVTQTVCNMSSDKIAFFNKDALSNLSDWTFGQKSDCPKLDFSNVSLPRNRTFLYCRENYATISSSVTNRTDDIFQVSFGSKCLADVIDTCCNTDKLLVPNVVHYVWCKRQNLGFFQFLSFISVLRFIKPCMILFHGDSLPYGSYWDYFVNVYPHVIHVNRPCPLGGKGHRLGFFEHGSDVMRIEALMFYGGIYLDWDEIMLRSVEELRKFKYTQGYEESHLLGSQFIMAERNATFLQHWYRGYINDYRKDSWTYNALMLPAALVKKFPHLIHTEGYRFTSPNWNTRHLIYNHNYNWTLNYAMHLFLRDYKKTTNETIIRNLNTTIGAVSRHVIFGNKDLCK